MIILTKKEVGRRGEEIAAEFLERKGLHIVERNYHSRWGELDLIAVKPSPVDFKNEVYFDETSQERNPDTMTLRNNCVHFVDATHATTIPCCGVVISARNRLTPQFMGLL